MNKVLKGLVAVAATAAMAVAGFAGASTAMADDPTGGIAVEANDTHTPIPSTRFLLVRTVVMVLLATLQLARTSRPRMELVMAALICQPLMLPRRWLGLRAVPPIR